MRPKDDTLLVRSEGSVSDAQLGAIAQERTRLHLEKSTAHGVVSRVYRLRQSYAGEGLIKGSELCVKRVVEEDQVAPHSVQREIAAYREMAAFKSSAQSHHVMDLYAAFRDDSDPFSVTFDLVMPWVPCTLQDILNEPRFYVSLGKAASSQESLALAKGRVADRRGARLLPLLKTTTPVELALQISYGIFSALFFLHETCAIGHRDVKPSNIVLHENNAHVQLIDFGTCAFKGTDGKLRYPPGDDGYGGLASEVGTGAYRAPECLLSPRNGYDVFAVDMWQAGATLVEFFMPLVRVDVPSNKKALASGNIQPGSRDEEESVEDLGISTNVLRTLNGSFPDPSSDDCLDWEKALWAKDDGEAWSRLVADGVEEHAANFLRTPYPDEDDDSADDRARETTDSGWKRTTLFDGSRGDLGLASSIFGLLGLPHADNSDGGGGSSAWPESADMQPPLSKLPFARQPPDPGGLRGRLLALQSGSAHATEKAREPAPSQTLQTSIDCRDAEVCEALVDVLGRCLQLSASQRITAPVALERLEAPRYKS